MTKRETISADFYGVTFGFCVEEPEIRKRLKRYLSFFLSRTNSFRHILYIDNTDIFLDGEIIGTFQKDGPLFFERLFSLINGLFFKEVKGYLVIHGGAVEKEGKVHVLPGFSGVGKSTLLSYLLTKGWNYFSDDIVLLNLRDKKVYPYPIPLRLKSPPEYIITFFKRHPDIDLEEYFLINEKIYYVIPKKIDNKIFKTGKKLSSFIFPYFSKRGGTSLTKLDKKEILFGLTSNCVNFSIHKRRIFDSIFELIKEISGYQLIYNDFASIEKISSRHSISGIRF